MKVQISGNTYPFKLMHNQWKVEPSINNISHLASSFQLKVPNTKKDRKETETGADTVVLQADKDELWTNQSIISCLQPDSTCRARRRLSHKDLINFMTF